MLRRVGDYPLRLVTRSYNGSEFQPSQITRRHRYSSDVRQSSVTIGHAKMLYLEHNTYRTLFCRGSDLSMMMLNLSKQSKFDNMPTIGWIIPPPLRNNGLHCVFVQVKKLVGYFSSRVSFSLREEFSSFIHLKQGNGFRPCMTYVSSHNGVTKKRLLNIWMDVFIFCCLQVILLQ